MAKKVLYEKRKVLYKVYETSSGVFFIARGWNSTPIWGGDSACEDHYDSAYAERIFENWDGSLDYSGVNPHLTNDNGVEDGSLVYPKSKLKNDK